MSAFQAGDGGFNSPRGYSIYREWKPNNREEEKYKYPHSEAGETERNLAYALKDIAESTYKLTF